MINCFTVNEVWLELQICPKRKKRICGRCILCVCPRSLPSRKKYQAFALPVLSFVRIFVGRQWKFNDTKSRVCFDFNYLSSCGYCLAACQHAPFERAIQLQLPKLAPCVPVNYRRSRFIIRCHNALVIWTLFKSCDWTPRNANCIRS